MKKNIKNILSFLLLTPFLSSCANNNNIKTPFLLSDSFSDVLESQGIFNAVLVWPISKLINLFSIKFGVFLGITIVTLIINIIISLIMFKVNKTIQMVQIIQPEILLIEEKYKGKKSEKAQLDLTNELQNVYIKYGVRPLIVMLFSFIQIPILLAMYFAVQKSKGLYELSFCGSSIISTPRDAFSRGPIIYIFIFILMIVSQIVSVIMPLLLEKRRAKKREKTGIREIDDPIQKSPFTAYGTVVLLSFLMFDWPFALTIYYLIVSIFECIKTIVFNSLAENEYKRINDKWFLEKKKKMLNRNI